MRIAVINEVSSQDKNEKVIKALEPFPVQVFNVGMTGAGNEPELTYIHTGLMAGIALNSGAVDLVIGGCGTGQGFLISAMQYPQVYCGLILDSLDAWLFSQINGGNCVSLALNKGFGWAADINLSYIFEKLFADPMGRGYPPHRAESQQASRMKLKEVSAGTHKDFQEILKEIDPALIKQVFSHKPFKELIENYATVKFIY
ncbi:MAG: RpiB/LacA/LacB family sugar-phosphate isomerase [Clostridia bacterium]|nr:RpiB/LacA/LacB family sugar-phosphate isomerase [Clostridia bacterium]MCR5695128.1 RpiB/LacA/LacB family sugar-phosphate isomerase [Clostridia bacterium]